MNIKKFTSITLIVIGLIFVLNISSIAANPVPPPPTNDSGWFFYIFIAYPVLFFVTIGCEYGILFFLLHSYGVDHLKLLKAVLLINLISFPITQLISNYFVYDYIIPLRAYNYGPYLLITFIIEIFIFALETLLFLIFLRREISLFKISRLEILFYIILANLCTYLIGLLVSFLSLKLFNLNPI